MLIWIVVAAAALFALDRLLLWMETKGWVYWRRTKRRRSMGPMGVFEPGPVYLAQAQEERAYEEEGAGDGGDDLPGRDDP